MSLAAMHHDLLTHDRPPGMPTERTDAWALRMPVMRAFPRLAVERVDEPVIEARWEEEPERWDGMA
ncbi:MAG: hypothetical protein WBD40_00250 [Tepidisphaeraceae bacterium]